MVLYFPNPGVLRRALGLESLGCLAEQPASAAVDSAGALWLEPAVSPPRAARAGLETLGVTFHTRALCPWQLRIRCWHELLPLEAEPLSPVHPDVGVLFLVASAKAASVLASLQRLGGCPQALHWLPDGKLLVRVTHTPLFCLAHAAEDGVRAFTERRPGLWVEAGFAHPLCAWIPMPPKQILLLSAPAHWEMHGSSLLQKFDWTSDLPLSAPIHLREDSGVRVRMDVPLRLRRSTGHADPVELWVLKDSGRLQLGKLLEQVDERILARLSFAVAVGATGEIVLLRLPAARQPPPILLLAGHAFRSYLKLPHLFVPCGMRLHPAVRRDAVRQLFCESGRITWLQPTGDGRFQVESLAEHAFQSLDQWVEYDRPSTLALSPWQQTARFELQPFTLRQDPVAPRVAAARQKPVKDPAEPSTPAPTKSGRVDAPSTKKRGGQEQPEAPGSELLPAAAPATEELRQRLVELQNLFLESGNNTSGHAALWREMAGLHAALGHAGDASLSWGYAFWDTEADSPENPAAWVASEASFDLERLTTATPSPADLRALVAFLFQASQAGAPLAPARLRTLQQLVEKHEAALPVRLAWLAHFALCRLARGDVLALARARDRVLERLYQHGLRLELDLPMFLRFSGKIGQERLLAVRGHLTRLHQHVQAWLRKHPRGASTLFYADLTFAFALARLGAAVECENLLAETAPLRKQDDLHVWLHEAYSYRIRQALRGETGPLSADLLALLNGLANDLRYKGDRLRQFSRILEPHDKIDARFRWHQHHPEAIERELAALSGLTDAAELWPRLGALLEDKKRAYRPYRGVILARALELAPRLGEEFARHVLGRVLPTLNDLTDSIEAQVLLLEKGLYLAAHYDQQPHVLSFVERFADMLAAGAPAIPTLEPLLGQLFIGLRKFGMRDVVGRLLERLTGLLLGGQDLKQLRQGLARQAEQGMLKQHLSAWKALLHVASGWLYFGQEDQARPILNETRTLLFAAVLHPLEQGDLAGAYIRSLGQADMAPAVQRWLELFRKIEGITAVFTTDSHFSLAQLSLVEALVLTLVSDDFALDRQARRWLEDDEFAVRRRIHRDVRAALEAHGGH